MKKILYLILLLLSIPIFPMEFTSDGKRYVEEVMDKDWKIINYDYEIKEISGGLYLIQTEYSTGKKNLISWNEDGTFNMDGRTFGYDTKLKKIVELEISKNNSKEIKKIFFKPNTKASLDGMNHLDELQGHWCEGNFHIENRNGKWISRHTWWNFPWTGSDGKKVENKLIINKNGTITIKFKKNRIYGNKDVIFAYDTELKTMVEIDKNNNLKYIYLQKNVCN